MTERIYKGPLPYVEGGKAGFKGREKETNDLFYLVSNSDFSVCYAESGEGKSSLINAGLCPMLRENGMFPVLVRFEEEIFKKASPDFDGYIWDIFKKEIADKAACKEKYVVDYKILNLYPSNSRKLEPGTSSPLWALFQTNELYLNPFKMLTPVLIFDQFEEVFTRPADISWTKHFFEWLEDFCLHISSGENEVKILLSLRSEYVCELDYWSMSQSQCFIPSLKNHRYYLKPLMKKAACAVLELGKELELWEELQDSSNQESLLECAKAKRIEHLPEGNDDGIPCISALLLSLMLSALEEKDEKISKYIKENTGKKVYDNLLGYVYEKALRKSDVNEECQKQLEDALIDGFGNRKKVVKSDLSMIPEEKLKSLEQQRIINEISGYYEISHDSICSVMNDRKKERVNKELKLAEEAKATAEAQASRLRNQRQDIIALSLLGIYAIFAIWFLDRLFCDETIFGHFFPGDIRSKVLSGTAIANFLFVPVIIYSVVKELRLASWLSGFWLISLLVTWCFMINKGSSQEEQMMIISLMSSGVVVSAIALYLSFRMNLFGSVGRKDIITVFTSLPFLLYLLIISVFIFCLCVFNTILGFPDPGASFWGVFVIPFLTHTVLGISFGRKDGLFGGGALCLILLLSLNTAYPFWELLETGVPGTDPFAFPFFIVLILLLFITTYIIWFYRGVPLKKRLVATGVEIVALYVTFIMNLGFWPVIVNYDRVTRVQNWLEITVKGNNHKYGIVSSMNDTIYPVIFDSIDLGNNSFCYISSNSFNIGDSLISSMKRITKDTENGITTFRFLHAPGYTKILSDMLMIKDISGLTDSTKISIYAAKTYQELLDALVFRIKDGRKLSLESIPSLPVLTKLQKKEFFDILHHWRDSAKKAPIVFGLKIKEKEFTTFSKSLARTFYLCMLKDRINKKDSLELFEYPEHLLTLYFCNSFIGEYKTDYTYISLSNDTLKNIFKTPIDISRLKNMDGNMWYKTVKYLIHLDYHDSYPNLQKEMDLALKILEEQIDESGRKASDELNKIRERMEKGHYSIWGPKKVLNQIEQELKEIVENIGANEDGGDYEELIDSLYDCLPVIIEKSDPFCHGALWDILICLYKTSVYHFGKKSEDYYVKMNEIDSMKKKSIEDALRIVMDLKNIRGEIGSIGSYRNYKLR